MLVCFVLWSRSASSFSIALKFTFGDKAGTDLLVLKQSCLLGVIPFITNLSVFAPAELSLDSANSGLGSPEPNIHSLRPKHRLKAESTPLSSNTINQIKDKAFSLFREGSKLSEIGSLSFSGSPSKFTLKVYSHSPKPKCIFTLKSGKEACNPDRAFNYQVDIFSQEGGEKLCSVDLQSNSYTIPTTGVACLSQYL
jgi:hypothetical protein